MKKVLIMCVLTAASFAGFAQNESKNLKFGLGVEGAFPLGTFGDAYSFGIGGTAQANYSLDKTLDLTLNAGYISFSGKSTTIGSTTYKPKAIGYIPVLAGIEYNFTPQVFGSAQLGLTFASGGGSGSAFTYAPGVGYKFTPNFNVLLKYTGYSNNGTSSTVGVRLGYTF